MSNNIKPGWRPRYFYLLCSEDELDIQAHGTDPERPAWPPFTITEMCESHWETYHAAVPEKRMVLPFVEAAFKALFSGDN